MFILGFIAEGFGNKMFMLTYYIHIFFKIKKYQKLEKLYLVHYDSFHEIGREEEKIYNIFPLLKNQEWLEWIDWDRYKKLKKKVNQFIINEEIKDYQKIKLPLNFKGFVFSDKFFLQSYNFFYKLYHFNDNFKKLNDKYDFNGVAIHVRLSDKINYIYDYAILNKNNSYLFTIFTPEYYIDQLRNFPIDTPVYIFTGSPLIFKKFYAPYFKHKIQIVDISFYESFYLLVKFKNIILSESTFSIFSSYFNYKHKNIYGHKLMFTSNKGKIPYYKKSNMLTSNTNLLESKKYFLNEKINKEFLIKLYKFSNTIKPIIK